MVWESSAVFSKNDYPQSPEFHCSSTLHMFSSSVYTKIAPSTKPIHLGDNNSNKSKGDNIENDTTRILAHAVFFIPCHGWMHVWTEAGMEGRLEAALHAPGQGLCFPTT